MVNRDSLPTLPPQWLKWGASILGFALVLFTLFAAATASRGSRLTPAKAAKAPAPLASSALSAEPASDVAAPARSLALEDAGRAAAPSGERALLDIGDPSARDYLESGFSGDEGDSSSNFAWSDAAKLTIKLPLHPRDESYRIDVQAGAFSPIAPVRVQVRINGVMVGTLEIASSFETRTLELQRGWLKEGVNELEFAYSKTASPHELTPGSRDTRRLAVRYDWLRLEPGRR